MKFRTLISSLLLLVTPAHQAKEKRPLALTGKVIGIDVRTRLELKINPSPGSLHIPITSLKTAQNLPENKDQEIYVFCESGGRSAKAKKVLEAKGYTNVKDVKDWRTWSKLNE